MHLELGSCIFRVGIFALALASIVNGATSGLELYNISRSWIFQGDLNTTTFQVAHSNLDKSSVQRIYFLSDRCPCQFNMIILSMNGSTAVLKANLTSSNLTMQPKPRFTYNLVIEYSVPQVDFWGSSTRKLVSNLTLVVINNPSIVDVCPEVIFATGGILVTVTGTEFEKAGEANLTVEIRVYASGGAMNVPAVTKPSEDCHETQSNMLICTMPLLNLDQLMENYSPNSTSMVHYSNRKKRETQSKTNIRRKRSSSATVTKNGKTADVKLVFRFQNYSQPVDVPNMIQFDLRKPIFPASGEMLVYDPSSGETLKINGDNLLLGCRKDDYNIELGSAKCDPADVTNNLISCYPPKVKPQPAVNSSKYCQGQNGALALMIQLGKYVDPSTLFFVRCVDYYSSSNLALALGLGIGLGLLFLLLVAVTIFLVCRCRSRKPRKKYVDEVEQAELPNYRKERPSYRDEEVRTSYDDQIRMSGVNENKPVPSYITPTADSDQDDENGTIRSNYYDNEIEQQDQYINSNEVLSYSGARNPLFKGNTKPGKPYLPMKGVGQKK